MLLRSLTWLVLFVVLAGCGESAPKPAPTPTAELEALTVHETHARDFAIDGVSFKTTEAEFRRSKKIVGDDSPKADSEKLSFKSETGDNITVGFYEGNVTDITVWYNKERLEAMGGVKTLTNQLVNKFGEPNNHNETLTAWTFSKLDRLIMLSDFGSTVTVIVQDPLLCEKASNAADEAKEAAQRKVKTGLE